MRRILLPIFLVASSFAAPPLIAQAPKLHFDGTTWWDYVKVLAGDKMEGRETGSDGLRRAQAFVVEQLKKNGIEPAASDGYYQPVRLIQRQVIEEDSSAAIVRDGKSESLVPGDDFLFSTRSENSDKDLSAGLVFVGYGLKIPEKDLDELAAQSLSGKIVVFINGSPSDVPAALASHYSTTGERWKSLHAAGAIGFIAIPNPASLDIPWSRIAVNRLQPAMDLADAEFDETQGLKLAFFFNPASAEKLFAGSGHTFAELAALAKDRKPLPPFPLTASIQAHVAVQSREVESGNLVAKLSGSDPALRMSSSSSPPISTISVSALPSTGTAFTTAPWTTPPAVPSFSTSRPASTPIPKNSADPSSSFSSPLKKKDSSARAISPLIRPSLQNPSSPTLTSTCFFRSFPLNFSK